MRKEDHTHKITVNGDSAYYTDIEQAKSDMKWLAGKGRVATLRDKTDKVIGVDLAQIPTKGEH